MPAASSPEFNEEDDITGVESLEQDDEDEVCPQMKTTETDFFFCHQSQFQRHPLYRYGNSLCLLDATYRTTKYALPLFFLAVKTNVGFSVVGEFVVQHETRSSIIQGLETIRTWMNEDPEKPENWEWNPKFFMTDFCEREIGAIEDVFAESFVFICDFHREQSWLRWTSKTDNGVTGTREKLLSMLGRVAHSCSTEEFEEAKLSLQNSEVWLSNQRLRNWFNKTWLSEKEKHSLSKALARVSRPEANHSVPQRRTNNLSGPTSTAPAPPTSAMETSDGNTFNINNNTLNRNSSNSLYASFINNSSFNNCTFNFASNSQ